MSSTTNSACQYSLHAPIRRVRTRTQLERKRECDRNNHKLMREKHRSRLELLESELRRLGNELSRISNSTQTSEHSQILLGTETGISQPLNAAQNPTSQYHSHKHLPNEDVGRYFSPILQQDDHNSSQSLCNLSRDTCPAVRRDILGGDAQVIGKDKHQLGSELSSFSQGTSSKHPAEPPGTLYEARPTRTPSPVNSLPPIEPPIDSSTIHLARDLASQDTVDSAVHSPSPPMDNGCMCPLVHAFDNPCFEFTVSTLLSLSHTALLTSVTSLQPLPRSPSARNYLLIDTNDNLVIKILSHALCDLSFTKLADMCAAYFIMYRLLRWRLHPDLQSYNDVPQFYRPTTIQNSIPHPLSLDFLAWPCLRGALIVNDYGHEKTKFSNDCAKAVTVEWPADKDVFVKAKMGKGKSCIAIHPDFETFVSCYENWKLSAEWGKMYPDFVSFVNLTGT